MEQELKEPGRFKDFYQFTFNFAKNPGQKGLGRYSWLFSIWDVDTGKFLTTVSETIYYDPVSLKNN